MYECLSKFVSFYFILIATNRTVGNMKRNGTNATAATNDVKLLTHQKKIHSHCHLAQK